MVGKPGTGIVEQLRNDPVLAEFTRPFTPLESEGDVGRSVRLAATHLGTSRSSRVIQFSLREDQKQRHWCMTLGPDGGEASETQIERPDLEIITDKDTWLEIVEGRLPPIEAFGQGRLRIRGDLKLARIFASRMAATGGADDTEADHLA